MVAKSRIILLVLLLGLSVGLQAQPNLLLFNEDFTGGSTNFSLNTTGVGVPTGSNSWIINNEYTGGGTYPNTTSQLSTVAGTISFPNGDYLHIHDQTFAATAANANYSRAVASDRFAILSSGTCTKGFDNVRFTFFWLAEGSANDYGELYYSADGGPWIKTGAAKYDNQTLWKYEVVTNPAFDNVNDLKFGFRWVNNTGIPPSNLSFAIDDIFILGDFDKTINPITIDITSIPATVCAGSNLVIGYTISDTLCSGQYNIELGIGASIVNTWVFNIGYPTTSSFVSINIPSGLVANPCYQIRISRVSPLPQITGTWSVCLNVQNCPNTITTLQPVVTIGSELPGGPGVCVGSVIDVPFWSTGTFQSWNTYTAQLSDSNGNFVGVPNNIGSFGSGDTFDPLVVPSPGNVSGLIPPTVDGCNYYIRVVSSAPGAVGTIWGPFCIVNCDVTTNNRQDIQFCINTSIGDTQTISYSINTPPSTTTYNAGNVFDIQVLSSTNFSQVNIGVIGSVASTTSGNITISIPPLPAFLALGMQPGMYYIRVVASSSNPGSDSLGSLIRMTIGAPDENPPVIFQTDSVVCQGAGDIVIFYVLGANPQSQYQWFLNNAQFPPNSPRNPLGVLFNGSSGTYNFTVQETNFNCVGPMSAPATVTMITAPTANITGPKDVCYGDTNTYNVSFISNTAYGWSISPPGAGTILINGADQLTIVWDSAASGSYSITLNLDYAANRCGATSGSFTVNVHASPVTDAGPDQTICEGDNVVIGGSPTGSGGLFPYSFGWVPGTALSSSVIGNPTASPMVNTNYIVVVEDGNGCSDRDTMTVNVEPLPLITFGPDTGFCDGGSIVLNAGNPGSSYNWSNGATGQTITVTQSGNYSVTVTTGAGCMRNNSIDVEVYPLPVAAFDFPDTLCLTNPVLFTDLSTIASGNIINWMWDFGDGTISGDQNPVHVYQLSGSYPVSLTVISAEGCTHSWTENITISPIPEAGIVINDSICQGFAATLSVIAPSDSKINWYLTATDLTPFHVGPSYTTPPLDIRTVYYIETQNDIGCRSNRVPVVAFVYPSPSGLILPSTYLADIPHAIIEFLFQPYFTYGVVEYYWEFGDGSTSTDPNPVYEYTAPGTYTISLYVKDEKGCENYMTLPNEVIIERLIRLLIPNAFSPNGDGLNDEFFVTHRLITDFEMHIFDRWGNLLYLTQDMDFRWNGKDTSGEDLPEGVYTYKFSATGYDGFTEVNSGTITLFR